MGLKITEIEKIRPLLVSNFNSCYKNVFSAYILFHCMQRLVVSRKIPFLAHNILCSFSPMQIPQRHCMLPLHFRVHTSSVYRTWGIGNLPIDCIPRECTAYSLGVNTSSLQKSFCRGGHQAHQHAYWPISFYSSKCEQCGRDPMVISSSQFPGPCLRIMSTMSRIIG